MKFLAFSFFFNKYIFDICIFPSRFPSLILWTTNYTKRFFLPNLDFRGRLSLFRPACCPLYPTQTSQKEPGGGHLSPSFIFHLSFLIFRHKSCIFIEDMSHLLGGKYIIPISNYLCTLYSLNQNNIPYPAVIFLRENAEIEQLIDNPLNKKKI